MAEASVPDYRAVRNDLGRHLRSLRADCPPMETARLLVARDGPGQSLVGVRHDGDRVVYFQASSRDAIAATFDGDGLDPRGGRPIGNLAEQVGVGLWVDKMGPYWGWIHPRYR